MLKASLILSLILGGCSATESKPTMNDVQNIDVLDTDDMAAKRDANGMTKKECSGNGFADVTNVSALGNEGNYQFSVTLQSPDTGCEQYANWWEVLDENGKLVYRRILGHSHVDEQPFTRSGGPADVKEDALLFIRAHMNSAGYGTTVFKGSVKSGFSAFQTECGFAASVEKEEPLPSGCAF